MDRGRRAARGRRRIARAGLLRLPDTWRRGWMAGRLDWQVIDVDHLNRTRSGVGQVQRVAVRRYAEFAREGPCRDCAQSGFRAFLLDFGSVEDAEGLRS